MSSGIVLPWAREGMAAVVPTVSPSTTPCLNVSPCTGCHLHKVSLHSGIGYSWLYKDTASSDRPILFVGEAPGPRESESGLPFIGPSGQYLWKVLRETGIPVELVALSNVVQCIPRYSLDDDFRPPSASEVASCHPRILREILALDPQLIVPLGAEASLFFRTLGVKRQRRTKGAMSDQRAHFYKIELAGRTYPVFSTYHPSAVSRDETYRHLFVCDLGNVKAIVDGTFGRVPRTVPLETTEEVLRVIRKARSLYDNREQSGVRYVSLDLETIGLDPFSKDAAIVSFSISWGGDSAFYVPVHSHGPEGDRYTPTIDVPLVVEALRDLFSVVPYQNQNAPFDLLWMACHWGLFPRLIFGCSLITASLLYGEQRRGVNGLDELGRDFCHTPQYDEELERYKQEHKITGNYSLITFRILSQYGGVDAWLAHRLQTYFVNQIFSNPVFAGIDTAYRLSNGVIPAFVKMELVGPFVDQDQQRMLHSYYEKKEGDLLVQIWTSPAIATYIQGKHGFDPQERLASAGGMGLSQLIDHLCFNPRSSPQVAEVLFDFLGVPFQEEWRAEKGLRSTEEAVLLEIKAPLTAQRLAMGGTERGPVELFIEQVLELRGLHKMVSTYVDGLLPYVRADGSLQVHYKIDGASTGRASAEKFGIHQMPKPREAMLRHMIVSRWQHQWDRYSATRATQAYGYRSVWEQAYPKQGGGLLASFDLSQLELRVLACASRDPGLLEAFEKGLDLHRYVASQVFYPDPVEELPSLSAVELHSLVGRLSQSKSFVSLCTRLGTDTAAASSDQGAQRAILGALLQEVDLYGAACLESVTKAERGDTKQINFGLVYGSEADGIAAKCGKSVEVVEVFIDKYFQRYPGVKAWIEATHRFAKANKHGRSLVGRIRYFFAAGSRDQRRQSEALRACQNFPIQSAASDITFQSLILLYDAMQSMRTLMVGTVHDSILFDVYPGELLGLYNLVKNVMEKRAIEQPGFEWVCCPILVDAEVGRSWGQLVGVKSLSQSGAKFAGHPDDMHLMLDLLSRSYSFSEISRVQEETKDGPVATVSLGPLEGRQFQVVDPFRTGDK